MIFIIVKVLLENGLNSKRMITEGGSAIPLKTTRRAFGNQEKSKQISTIELPAEISVNSRDKSKNFFLIKF